MTFRHLKNLDAISTLKNIRDRIEVTPGVRRPPTAVVSYMSVRTGSFRYRQRLDLSQSVRGGANGAWPRTRQKWGWARKSAIWRVRGRAPFALPWDGRDKSRRRDYLKETVHTLM